MCINRSHLRQHNRVPIVASLFLLDVTRFATMYRTVQSLTQITAVGTIIVFFRVNVQLLNINRVVSMYYFARIKLVPNTSIYFERRA
jgi:hypothetical protein